MAKTPVQFRLNGSDKAVFVDGGENLLNVLRRGVGDMSPKYGCGQGTCGVCTVLIDGEPQLACLTLAETCAGRSVETALGLGDGPNLHPLQTAFMEHFAAQCGFCTSGMLMAAKALLDRNPSPTREDVAEAISGNICRCTGYEPIINAILDAAVQARRTGKRGAGPCSSLGRNTSRTSATTASTRSASRASARTCWATSPAARAISTTMPSRACCI